MEVMKSSWSMASWRWSGGTLTVVSLGAFNFIEIEPGSSVVFVLAVLTELEVESQTEQ